MRGLLYKSECEGSLLSLEKEKVVTRVIDLYSLEKRSIVKADDLKGRRIENGCILGRPNHYKLVCIPFLACDF